MVHLGKNTKSRIVSKGISAGKAQNTYRGLVSMHPKAKDSRNYTQCDSLLIGDKCGAHTVPYIEVKNNSSRVEHEATTSKVDDDQLFYCRQRGMDEEEAVALVVNGFCKEVLQALPMEFAMEAQQLVAISLKMLEIKNLHVKLEEEDKQILKGVDLTVEAGKVHAIMGPNGSGKSTLSYVLSGRDGYEVTDGSATLGRGPAGDGARRTRRGGPVPGVPVPGRNPRRGQHDLPAHRAERAAQGARRGGDQRRRFPQADPRPRRRI
jgi:ABC-type multidrug transport system fused ATPase/permease subunit